MTSIDKFSQLIFNTYEAYTVAIYVKEGKNLRCISSITFSRVFDKNRHLPIEGTLPGWVIKHNQPLIIPNFDKDEEVLGYYSGSEDIKSFMGYPMGTEGVIVIDSKKKWVFTDKEKKILGNFASIIIDELEKEKKYSEIEEKLEEFHAEKRMFNLFNEILYEKVTMKDILKECTYLTHGDFSFIGIEQNDSLLISEISSPLEKELENKKCSKKDCIASMVLEGARELLLPYDSGYFREKPLFFPEENFKARQFFGFPLVIDDTPFGVLGVVSLSEKRLKDRAIQILRDLSLFTSLYYSSLLIKKAYNKIKIFEPVTGAIYFSRFLKILEEEIKKGNSFCIASIRLNIVEALNRSLGSYYTDTYLKKVFNIIKQCVGSNAVITRKNGGHFYALIGFEERANAKNVLKLLKKIISKNISEELRLEKVGVLECGHSFFPEDAKNIWDLLTKSDKTVI